MNTDTEYVPKKPAPWIEAIHRAPDPWADLIGNLHRDPPACSICGAAMVGVEYDELTLWACPETHPWQSVGMLDVDLGGEG